MKTWGSDAAGSGKSSPYLRIITALEKVTDFPLTQPTIRIGRDKDNDIVLSDPRISRHHAEIVRTEEGYVVSDLGSANRIRVNGEKVIRALLQPQDEIEVGPTKLIFMVPERGGAAKGEHLVFEKNEDLENLQLQSIQIRPEDCANLGLESVVMRPKTERVFPARGSARRSDKPDEAESGPALMPILERTNKVLYVLYEISRQLNEIRDHKELFRKIMDLIFQVIEADYGFLVLVNDEADERYDPIVVKFRDAGPGSQRQVKASQTLINKVVEDRVALLTSDAQADSRFEATESLVQQEFRSSMCVPLLKDEQIIGVIQLVSTKLSNRFGEEDLELLKSIGCQMALVLEQVNLNEKIKEEERLRNWLSRYHSPQIIEAILQARNGSKAEFMEAKDQEVTILFADIIGFTRLSEVMTPREVNQFLNEYFSLVTDIVFEFDGTLDKYIGDGLMAVFGAPVRKDNDAERAVRAALKMRRKLKDLMPGLDETRRFNVRMGINTGHVVAGNIGSPKRLDYTVIGDAVNVASRLESIAQPSQILIGETTRRHIEGKFNLREIGFRLLRGRSSKTKVYEVIDEVEKGPLDSEERSKEGPAV